MRQFNLKEYLKNPNIKLQTRDGFPVRIICTDLRNTSHPIAAAIIAPTGCETVAQYDDKGQVLNPFVASNLFFAPIKYTGYINVAYIDGQPYINTTIFSSKKEAEKQCICSKVVEVNWEL